MHWQGGYEALSQSGGSIVRADSCKQSGLQTGLEVERLSQIKTQHADQLAIHMCLHHKSVAPQPDMSQV